MKGEGRNLSSAAFLIYALGLRIALNACLFQLLYSQAALFVKPGFSKWSLVSYVFLSINNISSSDMNVLIDAASSALGVPRVPVKNLQFRLLFSSMVTKAVADKQSKKKSMKCTFTPTNSGNSRCVSLSQSQSTTETCGSSRNCDLNRKDSNHP